MFICYAGCLLKTTVPKCLFSDWKWVIAWDVVLTVKMNKAKKCTSPAMDRQ